MPVVIPAINSTSFKEVEEKIKIVEPYVDWAHLDVADGTFTPNSIWHEPRDLANLKTRLKLELHLMISDMDIRFPDWILPNVSRIIFHLEAAHDPLFVADEIRKAKKKVGLALRPETAWQMAEPFSDKVDLIQTLAVLPGRAGGIFRQEIIDKIKHLRNRNPDCIIEADGGINPDTGKKCVDAGANILVSASYIFDSESPKKAIEELRTAK